MREAFVTIATGLMGIGKSYVSEQVIKAYAKANPTRSILIFDPNFEDTWNTFPSVHFDILEIQRAKKQEKKTGTRIITDSEKNISKLPPGIRIIVPFTIYKERMNTEQMQLTMITICNSFRNGLVMLEDVNKYTISFEKTEIQSAFKAVRHNSQDFIIHLQSLNPIRPVIFEATRVLRMHYDGYDLNKIKSKIADYFDLLKIAQLIINKKYRSGEELSRNYDPEIYKTIINSYKRFYLFVHLKDRCISGITKTDFIMACNEFLTENQNEYKAQLSKVAYENKVSRVSLATHHKARALWIKEKMYYFKG